ncbi:MAG TPA: T9SS type A sorting domain-containing protein, partial [Chitinophagaceae bacterium]|nr:T9SS type A sorting domain-containing protein [Chitinophagaceae bacterium]
FGPGGATLAVNLKAFSVNKENEFALLKWTTAGEEKNDRFDIERSKDGLSFEKVGTVSGHGTTNDIKHYEFRDGIASASGVLYYRLSIVDTDGKITYSKIVALRLGGLTTLNNFAVYPNPFTSNVKMQINSARESKITVRISNAAGVQVASRNFTLQQGENIVVIKDLDALAPGLHMLEIISEDGKVTQKIMKR